MKRLTKRNVRDLREAIVQSRGDALFKSPGKATAIDWDIYRKRVEAARFDLAEAERGLLAALREYFSPGAIVTWQHGRHWRDGTVARWIKEPLDRGSRASVRIKSASSGKIVRVAANRLGRIA